MLVVVYNIIKLFKNISKYIEIVSTIVIVLKSHEPKKVRQSGDVSF